MITGFDPDAGLRAKQASRNPAQRIEVLARPGETRLQMLASGHLAEARLHVVRVPPGYGRGSNAADGPPGPAKELIGDSREEASNVLNSIELWVDGCSVEMPPSQAAFTDTNSANLSVQDGFWVLEVHGSGDGDDHTVSYTFDRRTVKAQRISWYQADYDARWSISLDADVYPRECHPAGVRRFGSRAELRARASR